MHSAAFYIADIFDHENRPMVDDFFSIALSIHAPRAAALLLCIVTEIQAYFHFDDNGARINERIHEYVDCFDARSWKRRNSTTSAMSK